MRLSLRAGYAAGFLTLATVYCPAGTNVVSSTAAAVKPGAPSEATASQKVLTARAQRAEELRMTCIEGRRYICGRVLQILPEGLVVDSGYTALLSPPFNQSWIVRGNVSVTRNASLVEEKKPDAVCVGLVFLSNIPKRPSVRSFDYVVIHGYPAGQYEYAPVPGVKKNIRRFSASLEHAVSANMAASEK